MVRVWSYIYDKVYICNDSIVQTVSTGIWNLEFTVPYSLDKRENGTEDRGLRGNTV